MERRRIRPRTAQPPAEEPAAIPTGATSPPPAQARVHVSWGALSQDVDLQGMTVAEAHRSLREPMHIAPGAEPLVNGRETGADYVLEPNDRIEWVMRTGEKGIR